MAIRDSASPPLAEGELRYSYHAPLWLLTLWIVVTFGLAVGLFHNSAHATYAGLHGRGSVIFAIGAQIVSSFAKVGLDAATQATFVTFAILFALLGVVGSISDLHGRIRGRELIVDGKGVSITNRLLGGTRTLRYFEISGTELMNRGRILSLQSKSAKALAIVASYLPSRGEFEKVCTAINSRVAASHDARKP